MTSTVKGRSSEVPVGRSNWLDHDGAASIDNILTIPTAQLGRLLGDLSPDQEELLAQAIVLAFDLDVPLLE